MEKYYKNIRVQTKEHADLLLDEMDNFISSGIGGQPRVDSELMKIWNNGDRLPYEFSEKPQEETDKEEQLAQSKIDKIELYKNDLELWKDEQIRPTRNSLMSQWVDSIRDHGALWEEQSEEVKSELLSKREELKAWPSTFTEYVENPELPEKPSYIT